jgi:hypothetical protein
LIDLAGKLFDGVSPKRKSRKKRKTRAQTRTREDKTEAVE